MTLTADQTLALAEEVANDPTGLGLASWLPAAPGKTAELLNAPSRQSFGVAPGADLVRAMVAMFVNDDPAQGRVIDHLRELSQDSSSPLRPLARSIVDVYDKEIAVNFAAPAVQALYDRAVAAGLFTPLQAEELKALSDERISRAHELGLPQVTDLMVLEAFNG